MWRSRKVARLSVRTSASSSASGSVRQRSRAAPRSSAIRSRSSTWPSRSAQALSARPSTPIVSAWRVQRSGVAIAR